MDKIFYNVDMAKAVRSIPKPVESLQMTIRGLPNTLAVTVFEEDVMQHSEIKQEEIMKYLFLVRDTIESYGVPCLVQGIPYDPNNPRKFK